MSIQPIRDENLYLSTIIVLFMVVMMFGVLQQEYEGEEGQCVSLRRLGRE